VSCDLVAALIDERPFVLASGSPRRARILEGLGLRFEIEAHGVDEGSPRGETGVEHAMRLALEKARAAAGRRQAGTVLGADTIVILDKALLGKPASPDEAVAMLRRLRGRWHEVVTGVALVRASDGAEVLGHERTRVLVRDLSDDEIDGYVAGGEPLDKAGSYGIQECGAAVVERVEGCFYNVVGLPVARLCILLRELGSSRRAGTG